jgi:hypothetical protein
MTEPDLGIHRRGVQAVLAVEIQTYCTSCGLFSLMPTPQQSAAGMAITSSQDFMPKIRHEQCSALLGVLGHGSSDYGAYDIWGSSCHEKAAGCRWTIR